MLLAACVSAIATASDRQPLPARWVERPVVMPKGWTRVELGAFRGAETPLVPLAATEARFEGATLQVGHGLLPRIELSLSTRLLRASGPWGLSDPELGVAVELLRREPPNTSVALRVSASSPHGAVRDGVPLGLGLPAFTGQLSARQQLGPLGLDVDLGGVVRLAGPLPAADMRLVDPADEVFARVGGMLQAGPLVAHGEVRGAQRSASVLLGTSDQLDGIQAATLLTAGVQLRAQLTRGSYLLAGWRWPLMSAPPLPGDAPSRGLHGALGVAL
ncbi:MAG: hypothetical protein KTR31_41040 [Myxococcales bacterium]|nr:hypothetical protein [Myxococcales bacterium]